MFFKKFNPLLLATFFGFPHFQNKFGFMHNIINYTFGCHVLNINPPMALGVSIRLGYGVIQNSEFLHADLKSTILNPQV